MSNEPFWEDMQAIAIEAVPLTCREDAELGFSRADVPVKAEEMEWRHKDGFYAARHGKLFVGFKG